MRRFLVLNPARIEPREIQRPSLRLERHEGKVGILLRQDHQRGLLALHLGELRKLRAAAILRGRGQYRLAVAPDGLDARAVHRQAAVDRLHEHFARPVLRLLHDETQIGDQDQPRILNPVSPVLLLTAVFVVGWRVGVALLGRALLPRNYGAHSQQEKPLIRLCLAAKVAAQVDAVIGRLTRRLASEIPNFDKALHHLVRQAGVHIGLREIPHGGRDVL